MPARWLELARRFQALAQTGLAYCKDPYDQVRYEEIRRLAAEMLAMLLEFINLVYGQLIIRFAGPSSQISSAVTGLRIQACGLCTATALNRAHSSLTRLR